MNNTQYTTKHEWDVVLGKLVDFFIVYAPVLNWECLDYEIITPGNVGKIRYNQAKPVTPLKTFFIPVRENLTLLQQVGKKRVIIGAPECDLQGLKLIDEIYLNHGFTDPVLSKTSGRHHHNWHGLSYHSVKLPLRYLWRKTSSGIDRGCYNFLLSGLVFFEFHTEKGINFRKLIENQLVLHQADNDQIKSIMGQRSEILNALHHKNSALPDFQTTKSLITNSDKTIWDKYAKQCVSCGACAANCPTCTCFLLTDKPGFEKIRNLDACQYPGFAKVAAGEDPLKDRSNRFRNRYMCKYVWKSERFHSQACTGCGRCIDACIGNINKNELIRELAAQ